MIHDALWYSFHPPEHLTYHLGLGGGRHEEQKLKQLYYMILIVLYRYRPEDRIQLG